MKHVLIGLKDIELYDSIEELPIVRFHKYNKCVLVDAGVGSDIAGIDRHLERMRRYLLAGETDKAAKEAENLRQNIYMIQESISPRYMAFAVLVKSIDGKPCNDLSDEALRDIINALEDTPGKIVTACFDAVKKKIDQELRLYFPTLFDDAEVKEYYDKLKSRTLLILHNVELGINNPEGTKEVDSLSAELITYFNPEIYGGSDGLEVRYDKQFESLCLSISKNLNTNAKTLSVLAFYNALEHLKRLQKELGNKSRKR